MFCYWQWQSTSRRTDKICFLHSLMLDELKQDFDYCKWKASIQSKLIHHFCSFKRIHFFFVVVFLLHRFFHNSSHVSDRKRCKQTITSYGEHQFAADATIEAEYRQFYRQQCDDCMDGKSKSWRKRCFDRVSKITTTSTRPRQCTKIEWNGNKKKRKKNNCIQWWEFSVFVR